jgi:hypothetical protein
MKYLRDFGHDFDNDSKCSFFSFFFLLMHNNESAVMPRNLAVKKM